MNDILTRQIVAARPPTAADHGWATSTDGRRILTLVLRNSGPTRHRRRLLAVGIGGAVVVAGGATAAVASISSAPPANRHAVLCNERASLDADGAGLTVSDTTPAGAARACSANWTRMFPNMEKPQRFAICVYPKTDGQDGGGQVAIPATKATSDYAVCKSLGTVPAG